LQLASPPLTKTEEHKNGSVQVLDEWGTSLKWVEFVESRVGNELKEQRLREERATKQKLKLKLMEIVKDNDAIKQ
jgi:hypothetical protein